MQWLTFCRALRILAKYEGHHIHSDDHITRNIDDEENFSALAFKIMTDPFVGKLTFFRVYSGTLKAGLYIIIPIQAKKKESARLLSMHANHREDLEEVYAAILPLQLV